MMETNNHTQEELDAMAHKVADARDQAVGAAYSVNLLNYLIAEIDLEEPEFDAGNPLKRVWGL